MGLSNNINDIIKENYKAIVYDVPFKDILVDLRTEFILTHNELIELDQCRDHRFAGCKFLNILTSRSNADFFKFCDILKSSTVTNIQGLGQMLEYKAKDEGQAQAVFNFLRAPRIGSKLGTPSLDKYCDAHRGDWSEKIGEPSLKKLIGENIDLRNK